MKQQKRILPLTGSLLVTFAAWEWQFVEHWQVLAGSVLLVAACSLLFSTFRQPRAMSEYLLAYACLAGMALLVPAWAVLIPVMLLASAMLQSLSPRTFLAAVIGLAAPLWILFGILFIADKPYHFLFVTSRFFRFYSIDYSTLTLPQMGGLVLLAAGGVPALLRFPRVAHLLRAYVRVRYLFLAVLFVGTLVYLLLQPTRFEFLFPILIVIPALFFGEEEVLLRVRWKGTAYRIALLLLTLTFLSLPLWAI